MMRPCVLVLRLPLTQLTPPSALPGMAPTRSELAVMTDLPTSKQKRNLNEEIVFLEGQMPGRQKGVSAGRGGGSES